MVFSKAYPREVDGQHIPVWEEMILTKQEETEAEQKARQENQFLIRQCLDDARSILKDEGLMDMQSHVLSLGLSLFRKRASHVVYYKEEKCKEKFQKYWGKFKHTKLKTEKKNKKK